MKNLYSRMFGNVRVTVTRNTVFLEGEWISNRGVVYGLNYDIFGQKSYFGMDMDIPRGRIRTYIEDSIEKLYKED